MSVTTRALYPSDATVLGWSTIEDIRGWAGVGTEEWKDVATALRDETLDNVILVAGMPHIFSRASCVCGSRKKGPRHCGSSEWPCC